MADAAATLSAEEQRFCCYFCAFVDADAKRAPTEARDLARAFRSYCPPQLEAVYPAKWHDDPAEREKAYKRFIGLTRSLPRARGEPSPCAKFVKSELTSMLTFFVAALLANFLTFATSKTNLTLAANTSISPDPSVWPRAARVCARLGHHTLSIKSPNWRTTMTMYSSTVANALQLVVRLSTRPRPAMAGCCLSA